MELKECLRLLSTKDCLVLNLCARMVCAIFWKLILEMMAMDMYLPTSAGRNLHYMWCCHKSGVGIEEFSVNTPHYFMADVRDILHVIKRKQLKFSSWLKDFRRTNCFLLYNKRDSKPFRVYMRNYIGEVFRSLFTKMGLTSVRKH